MSDLYIVSTLSNDQCYKDYVITANVAKAVFSKTINGGAGIPSKKRKKYADGIRPWGDQVELMHTTVWIPNANSTQVTEEELEKLKNIPAFKRHLDKGFLQIVGKDLREYDKVSKVAANMKKNDGSHQYVENDERIKELGLIDETDGTMTFEIK